MSLEQKTAVLAISAVLGSCAALKSRKSRLRAGESLEKTLSTATPLERVDGDSPATLVRVWWRDWVLVVHALMSCCVVWVITERSNDVWMMIMCMGLAMVLVLHVLIVYRQRKESHPSCYCSSSSSSSPPPIHGDYLRVCTGRWMKDREASDSLDPVCDVMAIGGIMRFALQYIIGSDVSFIQKKGQTCFSFAAFSVVKWFKIAESYPATLGDVRHRRRDLRPGGMYGHMTLTDTTRFSSALGRDVKTPVIKIINEFRGYRPGTLQEVFRWPEDGLMVIDSCITNDYGSAIFTQIFRRKT